MARAATFWQMILRAQQAGRILSVNHSARMDPVVRKALELARHGACGDVLADDLAGAAGGPYSLCEPLRADGPGRAQSTGTGAPGRVRRRSGSGLLPQFRLSAVCRRADSTPLP